jgi:hypothetical protein
LLFDVTQLRRCMRTQLKWAKKISKSKYVRYRAVHFALLSLLLCVKEEFPFEWKIPPCPRAHMLIIFIKRRRQLNLSLACMPWLTCLLIYMCALSLWFHYADAIGGEESPFAKQTLGKIITSTRQKADIQTHKGLKGISIGAEEALY